MGNQFKVVLVSPGETQTEFWQVAQKRSGYLIDGRSPVPMASADTVAAVIARAIECPQPNVFMNWTERLLPILRGAFPAVLEHHYRVVEQH
jgi:short-subunit dehydrogenase